MSSNIRVVAFDLDGLMFDTEDVYWKAADTLLKRRGYAYTQEICNAIMGRPPKDCFGLIIKHFSLAETWQELQRESEDIFLTLLDDGFSAMPGLFELLDWLEKNHIPKGICTSSAVRVVSEVLARMKMRDRFIFVLTAEDIQHGKPDPEIYLKAADRFGVLPEEMLVLEDSIAGSKSAISAGAHAIAVRAMHNKDFDFSHVPTVVETLDSPLIKALLS